MTDYRARCHCGAVELRVTLSNGITDARRCTCSFCKRRGAANVSVPLDGLTIVKGQECLTLYQFNTHTAEHYFCSVCGNYTHHRRRSNPNEYGVNLGALDGINPADYEPIRWEDGINHPSDAER